MLNRLKGGRSRNSSTATDDALDGSSDYAPYTPESSPPRQRYSEDRPSTGGSRAAAMVSLGSNSSIRAPSSKPASPIVDRAAMLAAQQQRDHSSSNQQQPTAFVLGSGSLTLQHLDQLNNASYSDPDLKTPIAYVSSDGPPELVVSSGTPTIPPKDEAAAPTYRSTLHPNDVSDASLNGGAAAGGGGGGFRKRASTVSSISSIASSFRSGRATSPRRQGTGSDTGGPPSPALSTHSSFEAAQLERTVSSSNRNTSPAKVKPLKKSRSTGIAGALALSGVALASPSAQLYQPIQINIPNNRPSLANAQTQGPSRESIDSVVSGKSNPSVAGSGGEGGVDGDSPPAHHPMLTIDDFGDWGDVVDQLGTGYAVASSKRNSDFHQLFNNIPDDDYLIEDYGCALQRDILVQGRLYVSEHHLSFNANIFGWVTSLIIPFSEVVSIEKRVTAFVIPNAIQVTTLHARHTFASFLSRDTTYDLIVNIWRILHPVVPTAAALPDAVLDDDGEYSDGDDEEFAGETTAPDETGSGTAKVSRTRSAVRRQGRGAQLRDGLRPGIGSPRASTKGGAKVHRLTTDTCPTLKDLKEVCMDVTFPSAPEQIYNLMFTSGFMKDFWNDNQKLLELEIRDWAPEKTGSNLLARDLSYIKPLTGSFGPKQTKCMIRDETAHVDFDDFVCVITTTRTPDVPNGDRFAVKTRTALTWAKNNSCRVVVTTGVEWSKSSFLKGVIEKSCIEGQKTYHSDLEKAMRHYISQHRSEFLEEGQERPPDSELEAEADEAATAAVDQAATETTASNEAGGKVFSASSAARAIGSFLADTLGPVGDLVKDMSGTTSIWAVVVVVLLLSNIWTLAARPQAREPAFARTPTKTPDEVASAVRDVLMDWFSAHALSAPVPTRLGSAEALDKEVASLNKLLDSVEGRVADLRRALAATTSERQAHDEM